MEINIKKINPEAKVPTYAHEGDAGFDLFAIENVTVKVGERALVRTGIALEIPFGYVGLIWDKSGISMNSGMKTLGGVVDAGYRGEVTVGVINLSTTDYTFVAGHKAAQMLIQKVEHAEIKEVLELSETVRGENGYGSTGK